MTNLPVYYKKDQIVSLGSDFNKYYTLYAPKEYNANMFRNIITPDLIQSLVNESADIDVEIMDDNLFVYFNKCKIESPEFWQKVERLRASFNDKFVDSVGHSGTITVANRGVRLQEGMPAYAIVLNGISALFLFACLYLTTHNSQLTTHNSFYLLMGFGKEVVVN